MQRCRGLASPLGPTNGASYGRGMRGEGAGGGGCTSRGVGQPGGPCAAEGVDVRGCEASVTHSSIGVRWRAVGVQKLRGPASPVAPAHGMGCARRRASGWGACMHGSKHGTLGLKMRPAARRRQVSLPRPAALPHSSIPPNHTHSHTHQWAPGRAAESETQTPPAHNHAPVPPEAPHCKLRRRRKGRRAHGAGRVGKPAQHLLGSCDVSAGAHAARHLQVASLAGISSSTQTRLLNGA